MKKTLSVLLIIALFSPRLSAFTLPKLTQAASSSSKPYNKVDYRVIYDSEKVQVWSAKGNKNISVEAFQQQVKTQIEKTQVTGSQEKVDIGIQFEQKTKNSKLSNFLSSIGLVSVAQAFGWGGNFGFFYVYIHGPDYHSLGNCIRSNVWHYNVIIKRYSWTPDRYAWANLHIGTYYSSGRKCFVFYDSQHPWICWGLCGPSWTSLRNYLYYAMISVGVTASGALIWYAAGVLATVLLPVLLVF